MTNDVWAAVNDYVADYLLPQDPVLDAALAASDAAGLPSGTSSSTRLAVTSPRRR